MFDESRSCCFAIVARPADGIESHSWDGLWPDGRGSRHAGSSAASAGEKVGTPRRCLRLSVLPSVSRYFAWRGNYRSQSPALADDWVRIVGSQCMCPGVFQLASGVSSPILFWPRAGDRDDRDQPRVCGSLPGRLCSPVAETEFRVGCGSHNCPDALPTLSAHDVFKPALLHLPGTLSGAIHLDCFPRAKRNASLLSVVGQGSAGASFPKGFFNTTGYARRLCGRYRSLAQRMVDDLFPACRSHPPGRSCSGDISLLVWNYV